MKQLLALLRVYRIHNWRSLLSAMGTKRRGLAIAMVVLIILGCMPMLVSLTATYMGLYQIGASTGQGEIVLTFAFVAGIAAMLFLGLFQLISTFYYSKDSSLLVPMPIPARTIVMAKFIGVMTLEYLTLAVLVGPALVIYGGFAGPGLLYWVKALLLFLLLPVLPLVLASLLVFVLMRVTNLRRSRDMLRLVGGALGLLLALSVSRFVSSITPEGGVENLLTLMTKEGGLIELIGSRVPPAIWAAKALGTSYAPGTQALNLLFFLLAAVIGLALLAWAGELLFMGGLIGSGDGKRQTKKSSQAALQRAAGVERSALQALLSREAKLLLRTPVYMLNSVIPLVVLPFAFAPLIGQLRSTSLLEFDAGANPSLVVGVAVAVLCFLNASGSIASTAVSREGPYIWVSQTAPVPPRTHALAKLLFASLFSLLPLVMIAGVGLYGGLMGPVALIGFLLVGLLATTALNAASLTIDFVRPSLKWEDPQRAIKQNLNSLFGLLIGLAGAAIAVISTFLVNLLSAALVLPLLVLLFGGLAAATTIFCLATADARWGSYSD